MCQLALHEDRCVAERRRVERCDDSRYVAAPSVAARQNRHAEAALFQVARDGDDRRRLARAARGEVADRDHRPRQTFALQDAAAVEPAAHAVHAAPQQFEWLEEDVHASNSTMRDAVRAAAPRFCSTVPRARSLMSRCAASLPNMSAAKSKSSAERRTSIAPPSRRKVPAISRKSDMYGPKQTGTPAAAGSTGLCPPTGTQSNFSLPLVSTMFTGAQMAMKRRRSVSSRARMRSYCRSTEATNGRTNW